MTIGTMGPTIQTVRTADEKKQVLESTTPKIVDAKKYHGPAVTDFSTIKQRMKELT